VVAVAPLRAVQLERSGWQDDEVALPAGSWHDLLTDRPVTSGRLADLLADFPVALLVRAQGV
jgi:(1->4)-alpha-D-glucan 1-alpha-D-glucosylmutase